MNTRIVNMQKLTNNIAEEALHTDDDFSGEQLPGLQLMEANNSCEDCAGRG